VDLRAIQPLPVSSHADEMQHSQWNQVPEDIEETVA
jgi:hypothetical protein